MNHFGIFFFSIFSVTYLNSNSPLKIRFEEEITCMQKFLRSNEALTATLRELYTHRTYLNNAIVYLYFIFIVIGYSNKI